ncbi:MAG: hypothetical protein IKN89_14690 [Oscillospiraceae bacterium]|nr:hypothetical protein [Oscillospiraceae bacterium]
MEKTIYDESSFVPSDPFIHKNTKARTAITIHTIIIISILTDQAHLMPPYFRFFSVVTS